MRVHSAWNDSVTGICAASGRGIGKALQKRPPEQCRRLLHAEVHSSRASAGNPCGEGSEARGSAKTAAASSTEGRVKNEEPTFRVAGEMENFWGADHPALECSFSTLRRPLPEPAFHAFNEC